MLKQISRCYLIIMLFFYFCFFFYGRSYSGSTNNKTEDYIQDIGNGIKYSFDNPVWLIYAGGIGALGRYDDDVRDHFAGKLLPAKVAKYTEFYGYGLNWFIGNSYILGEYFATDRSKQDVEEYLKVFNEAFIVNMAFTFALKTIVKRERPGKQNRYSFPSGHTSGSFAVATVLYRIYGYEVGLPAYTLASITGLQRIHANKHWLSDVLTGALLGTLIGNGFAELIKNEKNVKGDKKYVVNIFLTL